MEFFKGHNSGNNNSANQEKLNSKNIIKAKEWLCNKFKKFIGDNPVAARTLAYKATLYLEIIAFYFPFTMYNKAESFENIQISLPLINNRNIYLYGLALLNMIIDYYPQFQLHQHCSEEKLSELAKELENTYFLPSFSEQQIKAIISGIKSLDFSSRCLVFDLYEQAEEIFNKLALNSHLISITPELRKLTLILLDQYNLKYFISLTQSDQLTERDPYIYKYKLLKVISAAFAVANFWISLPAEDVSEEAHEKIKQENKQWLQNYEAIVDLSSEDYKEQYNCIYALAYQTANQENIEISEDEETEEFTSQFSG